MSPEVEDGCIPAMAKHGLKRSSTPQSNSRSVSDSVADLDSFFRTVADAAESGLFMDFDGTLASIRLDPSTARPWAGVRALLHRIQDSTRTRLAIVSGRPASEVAPLLGMERTPEIWGLHGAECLGKDGILERERLNAEEQAALEAARMAVDTAGLRQKPGIRVEDKWNAIAVHWRGLPEAKAKATHEAATGLMNSLPRTRRMTLLQFDGGVELRAGRNKGEALTLLLRQLAQDAPVAYLGDDTTDEDAFLALGKRGLSVLVRPRWRPTAARVWLRPPQQLREFLSAWERAARS